MNKETVLTIKIPSVNKPGIPDKGELFLGGVTPVSLKMGGEIRAGSSGGQGCQCSKKNCGTGTATLCC